MIDDDHFKSIVEKIFTVYKKIRIHLVIIAQKNLVGLSHGRGVYVYILHYSCLAVNSLGCLNGLFRPLTRLGPLWDQLHTWYVANPTETELLRVAFNFIISF